MLDSDRHSARQRWCTGDVEARHALAYWSDTICRSFLEIDIDAPDRTNFRALLDQADLGPAMLYRVEADPQAVKRTPERIAQSQYAGYFLLQPRAGRLRFQQYGRDCCLETGESVLVDTTAPYQLECLEATRTVVLRFPEQWLKNWIPCPEDLACRPLRPTAGWSSALCAALASLEDALDEELALPGTVVADQVASLLALAGGPGTRASTPAEKLFRRIVNTIRDHCHEHGLTPGMVAGENGISTRYLHHVCAQSATTFGAELMRRRLESAQRLLSDRRFVALSVGEVAARCGFTEPSHFARRFRRAFGLGPTEFRAHCVSGRFISS
jgi:AraC-like DNA-binding protein